MKYLIDSHAFLWYEFGSQQLPQRVVDIIDNEENVVFLSLASVWEIGIKVNIGKMKLIEPLNNFVRRQILEYDYRLMEISFEHIIEAVSFPLHHRDPFDRLLVAQCKIENLPVISNDTMLDKYGVERIW
ncbi:MAG: type II toxin-antitoxin system VapC family toxin [Ignavibacteriales bacterium]|nr:type II toxin-antitoxin system VapC family toxin [Ignavibacteriales bacterium]